MMITVENIQKKQTMTSFLLQKKESVIKKQIEGEKQ